MLQIAPEKIAHVIIRAREYDVRVASWDDTPPGQEVEDSVESVLEDAGHDTIGSELKAFIDEMNVDEQVSLVAVMWIGRGTYEPEDLADALDSARHERINATSGYLLGVPLLSDYLEEGLDKLGFSVEAVESGVL